jgi:NAD(P)H-dependent FMN reductase
MPTLQIIIASTRPGRVGLPVARWFVDEAEQHGAFELDVADLAEVGLPFLDEPRHPRLHEYEHDHTKRWSARVAAADAYVFVMPEYNFGINAPLKNAIDFLHHEWAYKPLGLVTYGGVSAGTRAGQMARQIAIGVRLTPVFESVHIPFVAQFLDEDRVIQPNDVMRQAAPAMLDELVRLEAALRPLRSDPR